MHGGRTTQVVLEPDAGASILEYSSTGVAGKIDWLQPADASNKACFVMVPFCSRIANGAFSFAGQKITLPPNLPGEDHTIHGHGFQRAWVVDDVTASTADLSFTHVAGDWPWSYRCEQRLRLDAEKLSITLELTNLSEVSMPYGMGLHPYFPKKQGIVVTAEVASHLRLDDRLLPAELEPIPQELRLHDGLDLNKQIMDHVFCGWQHAARLEWPDIQSHLLLETSDGCNNLVIWAPQSESFCCVEPVSNLPDGFNQAIDFPDAFSVIQAGECRRVTFSFTPQQD